jgi:hypothetical protein
VNETHYVEPLQTLLACDFKIIKEGCVAVKTGDIPSLRHFEQAACAFS